MYDLPTNIVIGDTTYSITNNGDFRMILDCFEALNDAEISEDSRVLASLLIFYNDFNGIEYLPDNETLEILVKEMFSFFNCGQPDVCSLIPPLKLIDWTTDTQMIMAGVNSVANTEVRAETYVHWWTFMGYYMSIGESTLSTVVGIRHKILKGKKLEKYETEFKNENPQYFVWNHKTTEEQEAEDYISQIWNSN